jgi:hypothetical protein
MTPRKPFPVPPRHVGGGCPGHPAPDVSGCAIPAVTSCMHVCDVDQYAEG